MRVMRWFCCLLVAWVGVAGAVESRPPKKLLEYGWDVPVPAEVRVNIRAMEERPFDGILMRLKGFNHAFDPKPWTREAMADQMADLEGIAWSRFTDNFLVLYAANDQGMDWFDDGQWEIIVANLGLEAEAARRGRCVGICFDPEPYGANPWSYTEALRTRPFWQVEQQVRRRGAQFVSGLQATMPDLKLLTFFQLSLFGHLFDQPDPTKRSEILSSHSYALLPAFLNGMLDAAAPGVRIIDGNEHSYYYTSETSFLAAYHAIKDSARTLIAPENRARYVAQVQVGVALYIDQLVALRERQVLSHFLTPEDRLRYAEHNTYWALKTADEYVWCYSEKMNWWRNQVPTGLEQAIRSARARYEAGQALGFGMADIVERGEEAREAAIAARLHKRAAAITALAGPAPTIDGLIDAAWRDTAALEGFSPVAEAGKEAVTGATSVQVTYDHQQLYLAFRCAEPLMEKLQINGTGRDADIWQGDCVELFISTGEADRPYRHFIVNPAGAQWDGASSETGDDAGWNAEWQAAARREAAEWTVELAIPWSQIGGLPTRGSTRRVNLCRQRRPIPELSCWSTTVSGFIEPARFGVWSF